MKRVYMPGKTWPNIASILRDFPFAKLPLVMLYIDSQTSIRDMTFMDLGISSDKANYYGVLTGFSGGVELSPTRTSLQSGTTKPQPYKYQALIGYRSWEYQNKINAYRDIVRFAISPLYPLSINFSPKSFSQLGIPTGAFRMLAVEYLANKSLYNDTVRWFFALNDRSYADLLSKKDSLIDEIVNKAFSFIELRSPAEWVQMQETYGTFSDISQVPKNTIAYTVTNQPPPVKNVDWKNVDFWSRVFDSQMGQAILNAVAYNFPVKIATRVEDWKNPDHPEIKKTETDSANIFYYKWVFQDFIISAGPNNNILVQYNRGIGEKTFEYEKEKAWEKFLPIIGVIAVVAIAALPLIAGAGATAPAGTSLTGSQIAATAAPVSVTPITGSVPALTSVAAPTGAAVAEGSTISIAAAAKSVAAGSALIGGGSSILGGGGGAGGGEAIVPSGGSSLLDNLVSIAKPVSDIGMQVYAANQASKLSEIDSGLPIEGMLPTINGVGQYSPLTGQISSGQGQGISEIPMQWLIIGGVGLISIILLTKRRK